MTIAISMKVNDGIVLATDSASTMISVRDDGKANVVNIYDNTNKIFNLRKGFHIGAITWGIGSIGPLSISTLAKDFRETITFGEFAIDENDYTIKDVSESFKEFMFTKYEESFKDIPNEYKPDLGFMIVGYSADQPLAEEYTINISKGVCNGPTEIRGQNLTGVTWNGVIEPIFRMYKGRSSLLNTVLEEAELDDETIDNIINLCETKLQVPMVSPAMPIQDAIDFAIFLADTTAKFSKFAPGPSTVGGPIEVATITKYEGFKWIKRKHYFNKDLNPDMEYIIKSDKNDKQKLKQTPEP